MASRATRCKPLAVACLFSDIVAVSADVYCKAWHLLLLCSVFQAPRLGASPRLKRLQHTLTNVVCALSPMDSAMVQRPDE